MAGLLYNMAAVRNVIILKWWERVSPGGGVKKNRWRFPPFKMAAAHNVIILKNG
jgi:hypothetical protein